MDFITEKYHENRDFISENTGLEVQKGLLYTTINRIKKEWKISFDLFPTGLIADVGNILRLTNLDTNAFCSGFVCGVRFFPGTTELLVGKT